MSKNNEIKIIYYINKRELNIFGREFVKINRNICKMIIDNKEYDITEKYNVKKIDKNTLIIKLKGAEMLINMSYMFFNCSSLLSLPNISKWNTNNVTNMSYMFYNCKSLESLPKISNWKTDNVTNMSHMFSGCFKLKSLPDISKWKTDNVINMSSIFKDCSKLIFQTGKLIM